MFEIKLVVRVPRAEDVLVNPKGERVAHQVACAVQDIVMDKVVSSISEGTEVVIANFKEVK